MNAVADEVTQRGMPLIDEPMRKHTSWRVGGPADRFYEPTSVAELQAVLAALPAEMPVLWLGLGSNLLVRDGGIARRGDRDEQPAARARAARRDSACARARACRARCSRANACAGSSARPRSSRAFRAPSAARSR